MDGHRTPLRGRMLTSASSVSQMVGEAICTVARRVVEVCGLPENN
jgi:hypothetical protein